MAAGELLRCSETRLDEMGRVRGHQITPIHGAGVFYYALLHAAPQSAACEQACSPASILSEIFCIFGELFFAPYPLAASRGHRRTSCLGTPFTKSLARLVAKLTRRLCRVIQDCRTAIAKQRNERQRQATKEKRAVAAAEMAQVITEQQQPARNAAQQNAALPFLPKGPSNPLHVSHAHSRRSRRGHANAQPGRRTLLQTCPRPACPRRLAHHTV
jgi:hypothetical protein